jgi:hypothetical protein
MPDPPYVFREFPKWITHKHSTPTRWIQQIVQSADAQAALGPDWIDSVEALQIGEAPAVPTQDVDPAGEEWIVRPDLLNFLQFLLTEVRTWAAGSAQFSAFYDRPRAVLIGGPEDPKERRRQQQPLEEIIKRLALTGLGPSELPALPKGLEILREFAQRHHLACLRHLDLPGRPDRLDHLGDVLEQVITRSIAANALSSAQSPGQSVNKEMRAARQLERARAVLPLLEERDWTPSQWALKAGVGPSVALNYLSGKTKKLQTKPRQQLASALGKRPEFLP